MDPDERQMEPEGRPMEILVFGAGSLGSLIGGLLAREHDVTLIGREPHVRAIREGGLRITGELDGTVRPAAAADLDPAADPDLAVVTVKSFDTRAAARELAVCDPGAVLSLQNGMGNEATLAEGLEAPVLAGTTTCGAHLEDAGVVACTGVGSVTLGPWEPAEDSPEGEGGRGHERAETVGEAFRFAGVETTVVGDPRPGLWEKLAVNAGINPVTALARVRNGALVEGPAADLALRAAAETATVAREQGVDLPESRATEAVRAVAETTAANRSSMLADVAAGRRTEIDAINGYVLDHAEGDVPVNAALAGLIRTWEAGEGLR